MNDNAARLRLIKRERNMEEEIVSNRWYDLADGMKVEEERAEAEGINDFPSLFL